MSKRPETASRRRGSELAAAILAAAWEQLVEEGYERFTIDAVAHRARTSKHVVYRRWENREELLRATIRQRGAGAPPPPDTGSLRGDLPAVLSAANSEHGNLAAPTTAMLAGRHADIGLTPSEIRSALVGDGVTTTERIVDRAVTRGEIDPARIVPRVRTLPFDLLPELGRL
ncbi:MAG: TetR/AcrR family transcriptional regulator [Microbacteriaceae bacterium]